MGDHDNAMPVPPRSRQRRPIEPPVPWALGRVIGIQITAAASYVLSRAIALPYAFNLSINLLALVFSAFIGVVLR